MGLGTQDRIICQAGGVLLHKRHIVLSIMSRTFSILQKIVVMFAERYQGCSMPGSVEIQEAEEPAPNVTDAYVTGGKTSPKEQYSEVFWQRGDLSHTAVHSP